jgi:hypothetical protein
VEKQDSIFSSDLMTRGLLTFFSFFHLSQLVWPDNVHTRDGYVQLVVSNLTQVQRAVSKTETTNSFEPN